MKSDQAYSSRPVFAVVFNAHKVTSVGIAWLPYQEVKYGIFRKYFTFFLINSSLLLYLLLHFQAQASSLLI